MQLPLKTLKTTILTIVVLACTAVLFITPIAQDPNYHHFADERAWAFIPSFWNVVSNVGFFIVGVLGLQQLLVTQKLNILRPLKLAYTIFFIGVTLVAFGSGYYHWAPNNQTLVWDRLPMTIAFMALMSFVLAEFLSFKWARRGLWSLLLVGLVSVLYWAWGERQGVGQGDLRLYVLVQFLPMVLLLLLFVAGRPVFDDNSGYYWLLAAYVAAKLFEHFDGQIYALTDGVMAGHALKHMITAVGLYLLLRVLARRVQIAPIA